MTWPTRFNRVATVTVDNPVVDTPLTETNNASMNAKGSPFVWENGNHRKIAPRSVTPAYKVTKVRIGVLLKILTIVRIIIVSSDYINWKSLILYSSRGQLLVYFPNSKCIKILAGLIIFLAIRIEIGVLSVLTSTIL